MIRVTLQTIVSLRLTIRYVPSLAPSPEFYLIFDNNNNKFLFRQVGRYVFIYHFRNVNTCGDN